MTDPVKPQDNVFVAPVMTEKEDTYVSVHHSSGDVRKFALNHFQNLIPL